MLDTLIGLSPMILIFVVFWFFLIRPQQKQQKARQAMLGQLKVNDKVITIGGIYGTIVDIKDTKLTIRIADKVEIKSERFAVDKIIS